VNDVRSRSHSHSRSGKLSGESSLDIELSGYWLLVALGCGDVNGRFGVRFGDRRQFRDLADFFVLLARMPKLDRLQLGDTLPLSLFRLDRALLLDRAPSLPTSRETLMTKELLNPRQIDGP
jgi:hypothetical protein